MAESSGGPTSPVASAPPPAPPPGEHTPPASSASEHPPAVASAPPASSAEDPLLAGRNQLGEAIKGLQEGATIKKDSGACQRGYETAKRLLSGALAADQESLNAGLSLHRLGAQCAAFAGDCAAAWSLFQDGYPKESLANVKDEAQRTTYLQMSFGTEIPRCKAKAR